MAFSFRFLAVRPSAGAARRTVLSVPRDASVVSVDLEVEGDLRVKYLIVVNSSKVVTEAPDSTCGVNAKHRAADARHKAFVFPKPLQKYPLGQ